MKYPYGPFGCKINTTIVESYRCFGKMVLSNVQNWVVKYYVEYECLAMPT